MKEEKTNCPPILNDKGVKYQIRNRMIYSLKGRIVLITVGIVLANILLYSIVGDGVCNWINYAIMMVSYPIMILGIIENHIENEVIKKVHKIVQRYETLRDISRNDHS